MLADDVAVALSASGGATVAELAGLLGASEQDVSFALYSGHGRFRCDRAPLARWWLASAPLRQRGTGVVPAPVSPVPPRGGLALYPWQAEALKAWERRGGRGVVEAVTGAGKTMVGVAAAEDERARRGQVLVLVPTLELQYQWVSEFESRSTGCSTVGRLGAGFDDSLATHDVLVAVVNTARVRDVRPIRQGGLLIADECHRYGSDVNHLALDLRFRRRLGLSATYAREDEGNLSWLDPFFGGSCFRLGYARAVADAVTACFRVVLMGVNFSAGEQTRYEELTNQLAGYRARLIRDYDIPGEPFGDFMRTVMALANGGGNGGGVARAYRQAVLERRRLLADTPAKDAALSMVAPAVAAADRALVFTQSIEASERACRTLVDRGLRAAVMHSALPSADRRVILDRFASGQLDVLAAPRVLDEGVDVPAADLAVIAGASRSRRQMIQRMGRVLRRKPDGRHARFAVIFVQGTVEDPRFGAHESFLDEITSVAERVSIFRANEASERPGEVIEALLA